MADKQTTPQKRGWRLWVSCLSVLIIRFLHRDCRHIS